MITRSRAPLRLGLAGGGTDVAPFDMTYGGLVLNCCVGKYAYVTLENVSSNQYTSFEALDLNVKEEAIAAAQSLDSTKLLLHQAVHRKIYEKFGISPQHKIKVISYCDAVPGSGLGSSSTMVVALLCAYNHHFNLGMKRYDIAKLSFDVERIDCALSGGKQDQFSAVFGGFNLMEFGPNDHEFVNTLRIEPEIERELLANLCLVNLGVSRSSAKIIESQIRTVKNKQKPIEALHKLKQSALDCKYSILTGDLRGFDKQFANSWENKKQLSTEISNQQIAKLETLVYSAGASAFKVSGAGGGGYAMIFVDPLLRKKLEKSLALDNFQLESTTIDYAGACAWTV